ncbi:MAG: hypothetical protein IPN69_17685 [Acidobacteria bacterium]|nr:hypothetical protein [Acidobacteriota bacterium]
MSLAFGTRNHAEIDDRRRHVADSYLNTSRRLRAREAVEFTRHGRLCFGGVESTFISPIALVGQPASVRAVQVTFEVTALRSAVPGSETGVGPPAAVNVPERTVVPPFFIVIVAPGVTTGTVSPQSNGVEVGLHTAGLKDQTADRRVVDRNRQHDVPAGRLT